MSSRKNQTTHYQTNIVQVMQNKSIVDRMTFVYSNEGNYFLKGDKRLPTEEIESLYPTKVMRLDLNPNDPDSRKIA